MLSLICAAVILGVLVTLFLLLTGTGPNYPPGPARLPFIGNLLDLGSTRPWLTYCRLGEKYGDLFSLKIFKRRIIIINSLAIATELLEKRSIKYSDRADLIMLDLMGWGFNVAFMRYNDPRRRKYRRYIHAGLGQPNSSAMQFVLAQKSDVLIHQLLESPEDFQQHFIDFAGASILHHTFGFTDWNKYKYLVHNLAVHAVKVLSESIFFGAQMVFAFPMLNHLPDWFPGTGFKKLGRQQRSLTSRIQDEPIEIIKKQMATGANLRSWVSDLFEERDSDPSGALTENNIKELAANVFTAGFDTTSSGISSVILAMTLYPATQRRAQLEIDDIIGHRRLPEFSDRNALPYISAICREALRWHPPIPIAGHSLSETDEFMGYVIPAETPVVANIWAMTRDTSIFKDPDRFYPERFIKKDGTLDESSSDFVWGFGRRSCPGRTFAELAMWVAVARILAVYDIGKTVDSSGKAIPVNEEYMDHGIFIRPLPFKCSIVPRSQEARSLIIDSS